MPEFNISTHFHFKIQRSESANTKSFRILLFYGRDPKCDAL